MIITVVNQKGGVGKTDLAVNLASSLAKAGKKVLLVDLDPQANTTDYLTLNRPELTTGELLTDDKLMIKEMMQDTQIENLSLAPGGASLNVAQVDLLNDVGMQFKLKRKLRSMKHDYVIIDTPPSLGVLTINALTASDRVLVPVQVNYFATEGVNKLMNTVKKVKREINPKLNVMGFVLTMYDKRNKLSYKIEKMVRKQFGSKVMKTMIPVNVDLADAPSNHKPIMLHSRESRGAYAYANLAKEIVRK